MPFMPPRRHLRLGRNADGRCTAGTCAQGHRKPSIPASADAQHVLLLTLRHHGDLAHHASWRTIAGAEIRLILTVISAPASPRAARVSTPRSPLPQYLGATSSWDRFHGFHVLIGTIFLLAACAAYPGISADPAPRFEFAAGTGISRRGLAVSCLSASILGTAETMARRALGSGGRATRGGAWRLLFLPSSLREKVRG